MFKHVRLPLQHEIHRTDYDYAFGEVDNNLLSSRSSSTLFGSVAGSFFSPAIEAICIDTNIVDPEEQDKIG
ncbi:unnamed protein product [Rotaria sp. Silwood2]|nr:unnamed protein product [Rotaria sp. Silwood2]CAF3110813.1 unnamed protein product [Rotaria sp. Silwood2]CAF3222955.1 unnamed protein product [Rotaria sp. Silwood2]CAF4080030.1 unnamed protein product [Rotaria sp. Silwood2]CAF4185452.1 unnamed protein product [Rotaria sp. Silwood2]